MSIDPEEELRKAIAIDEARENESDPDEYASPGGYTTSPDIAKRQSNDIGHTQWQVREGQNFFPAGPTQPTIPPGNYWPSHDDRLGPFLQRRDVLCDDIIDMPDSTSATVLAVMNKFWASKAKYAKFGLLFKRGVLLWGPPGSGKSVTVRQLSAQVLALGGIVLHCTFPELLLDLIRAVRAIEVKRPIIVILEDIDEIISRHGEHTILGLLDGESQIENVVFVGTTNYPERLGARIVNRPSRFDDRIYVGMPSAVQRKHYLDRMAKDCKDIEKWVEDTEGFSIAHLRELIAAVYCLEADYEKTLERLKSMQERPKDDEGFEKRPIGLAPRLNTRRPRD